MESIQVTITEKEWRGFNAAIGELVAAAETDEQNWEIRAKDIQAVRRLKDKLQPFVRVS